MNEGLAAPATIAVESEATAGRATRRPAAPRLLMVTVALATTLAPLNSTMIAVALPAIGGAFDASVTATAWLVTLYLATMAIGQPIGGRLGDLYGRRRLALIGLGWFGVASVGCALADSLPLLIAFRAQQALAGALTLPNGTAIVREAVPAERRGAAFGTIGMAAGLAAAAGPPLGGVLVHAFGWSAIFWANVPVVAIALLLGARVLPAGLRPATRPSFDLVGSGLLALALGGVLVVPTLVKGGRATLAAATVAAGVVAAVAFVRWERRVASPVVDVGLFGRRDFAAACASIALSNFVMYTTLLALPLALERVRGEDARTVGAVLATLSLLNAAAGPVGGRLADRVGRRRPAIAGAVGLLVGTAALAIAATGEGLWTRGAAIGVMGLGLGIAGAPIQTAAIEASPPAKTGSAAGVFSTARYLGSVGGSTLLALAFTRPGPGDDERFVALFAALAAVAAAGVWVNGLLRANDG